jgi:hypothetical protein
MGWASGSALAVEVWELMRERIPKKYRQEIAERLVELFEDHDCDTMDECELLMKDAGLDDRWDADDKDEGDEEDADDEED